MASAEPRYHSGPVRCCAGTASTNCPSIEENRQPREMCVLSESDLYCVSTFMRRTPELAKFERTKSMIRYLPPNGTAGFARSWVSGASLLPSPPARIIAGVFCDMAADARLNGHSPQRPSRAVVQPRAERAAARAGAV